LSTVIKDSLETITTLKTFSLAGSVVAVGMFDGYHAGHMQVISRLNILAKAYHLPSVVITFWPHPRWVVDNEVKGPELLMSIDEKKRILDCTGIDYLVIYPFDELLAAYSMERFAREILQVKLSAKCIVSGFNHGFGKGRMEGNDELRTLGLEIGFRLEEVPACTKDGQVVSSSAIREALKNGDVHFAAKMLKRPYSLSGVVVGGNRVGNTIGFPTANIQVDQDKRLVPADGVYAVKVEIGDKFYSGMLNIGVRPTLGFNAPKSIEVNIFDFDGDLYGWNLVVHFIARLRDEMRFGSLEQLVDQLNKDKSNAVVVLNSTGEAS
jgi:riboflavin kinase / FMN adenylyltransferase